MKKGLKTIAALSALWPLLSGTAFVAGKNYGPGVTDAEITVGQSVPYSGPASAFGIYGRVMLAYFEMVNEKGSINGRKVKLISLDNGYSPPKAIEDSRKLVEEMDVLAEVGTVGTPPNVAVQKYLNGKGVPQLFASAGGSRFNDPQNYRWTVPFYPGFAMEGAVFARYVLKTKPDAKMAVLYQNDDYGKDYLKGLKRGLGAGAAKSIVAEASYELSDPTVDSQVVSLQGAGADTVLEFATPKFAAQAIRKIGNLGWKPLQIVGSPASSINGVLKPAGFDNATGLLTSQFAKQPADPIWSKDKEVADYLAFMKRWAPNEDASDFVGLSGYINAEGVALVLRRCGDDLSRENLLKQATTIRNARVAMLLPGIDLNNSPSDYALYHKLRLARFDGTSWVLIGEAVSESD
ncbi:MAG TPA: ABC transporter substrate-binding protein [Candidatus Sulfotelmatobacter sp.]|nr:ABC transporter substrate-binding protein [Candidatus Sulfotelmatobacter sp.]